MLSLSGVPGGPLLLLLAGVLGGDEGLLQAVPCALGDPGGESFLFPLPVLFFFGLGTSESESESSCKKYS